MQSDKRLCFFSVPVKCTVSACFAHFCYSSYSVVELADLSMALMLTPKTDFLGTGPILYVCKIVFCLQEKPIFATIYHVCY